MRMQTLLFGAGVIAGLVLSLPCAYLFVNGDGATNANAGSRSQKNFLLTRRAGGAEERRQAAIALAKQRDEEDWCMILLLDKSVFDEPRETLTAEQRLLFAPYDRAVIASLLENIPTSASAPLLWAITTKLDDAEEGKYSYVKSNPPYIISSRYSATTRPIRSIARETLTRALGEDLGFDQVAWRRLILRHPTHPPTTTAATEPR